MGDFNPATTIRPRAIIFQIVEGGPVDVSHAVIVWDALLPSGNVQQITTGIDDLIGVGADTSAADPALIAAIASADPATKIMVARKMLLDAVAEVQARELT